MISWLLSSDYDKIRNDSYFNTFYIRVGGQEVKSQMQILTENRLNKKQADENFKINEKNETLELLPQLNILDRDQ